MSAIDQLINYINNTIGAATRTYILPFAAGIVVLMIIIGGVQYIQGNAEAGKKTLWAAIIGIIIIVLANVIVATVVQIVTGK